MLREFGLRCEGVASGAKAQTAAPDGAAVNDPCDACMLHTTLCGINALQPWFNLATSRS